MTEAAIDTVGNQLIELGLVHNEFLLDLNHALTVPDDQDLPAPWNLPSRLFRFPVEVSGFDGQTRRIGLMHPLLGDHPFVRQVIEKTGLDLNPRGAPNAFGYTKTSIGPWWHAVDLMMAGKWRELLDTRRFTTDDCIASAVAFTLTSSTNGKPLLSVRIARQVLAAIGSVEPAERGTLLQTFMRPSKVVCDKVESWPINDAARSDPHTRAWATVAGIEEGWFKFRGAHLNWSQLGRDRYAAGGSISYVEEKTGQMALAF